jgi:threonine/homoserine/homoserine lactone efflux protein
MHKNFKNDNLKGLQVLIVPADLLSCIFRMVTFIASVVLLSLSGVLMPGPVTAVTVARGADSPHAGAWVSVGHGVIEFPLMALIYFGAGVLFQTGAARIGIGIAGGAILLWMGIGMLRDYDRADAPEAAAESRFGGSPFVAGMVLSAGNPYFLVWWATAGAALISQSWEFGLIGFAVLAVTHWLCDFTWYYFLSALSFGGGKFFGRKVQQAVFVACGFVLLYFSGYFAARAAKALFSASLLS